jgi:hypothetical protein
MWPKFLNSKWFERLFTATLSIMLLLITQYFTTVREDKIKIAKEKAEIESKINERALSTYVDSRCKDLKEEIKKGDDDLRVYVDRTIVTFSEDIRELRNYIIYKRIGMKSVKSKDILIRDFVDPIKPIEYTELKGYTLNNIDIKLKIN